MTPLLDIRDLVKEFVRPPGFFGFRRPGQSVRAVDGVSFAIDAGETFGLVGESGSGKTTTGRCVLRLIEPTSGEIRFQGEDVLRFSRERLRLARRQMQIVFQDPVLVAQPTHARTRHRRRAAGDPRNGAQSGAATARRGALHPRRTRSVAAARCTHISSAAASASGLVWREHWRSIRRSSSPTNLSRRLTYRSRHRSSIC